MKPVIQFTVGITFGLSVPIISAMALNMLSSEGSRGQLNADHHTQQQAGLYQKSDNTGCCCVYCKQIKL